jgi:hypothetical protein
MCKTHQSPAPHKKANLKLNQAIPNQKKAHIALLVPINRYVNDKRAISPENLSF